MIERLKLTMKITFFTVAIMGLLFLFCYGLSLLPLEIAMIIFGTICLCGIIIGAWTIAGK